MNVKYRYIYLTLLTILKLNRNIVGKKLLFANVVWRHGDRSYMETYPNDPYKDKDIWVNGYGQLTKSGMHQQYELGRFLRTRYGGILRTEYRRSEIYIRSTDLDRTIMSAECNLDGWYTPVSAEALWNGSDTRWQPIPVHTVPQPLDTLLRYPDRDCPKYVEIRKMIQQSPWYLKYEEENSEFYSQITNYTGSSVKYCLNSIWHVSDNLFCLQSNGFKLPDWATPDVMKKLMAMNGLDMGLLFTDYEFKYRNIMSQMQGGFLLKEIIMNMTACIEHTSNLSMIAYSAHDTTLTALLVTIGNYNWIQPVYASCIMFELYEDDNKYYVEIYYKYSRTENPMRLKFYDCEESCEFGKFVNISQKLIPENRAESCQVEQSSFHLRDSLGIFVLIIIFLFGLIFFILCMLKREKEPPRSNIYQSIKQEEEL